LSLSTRTIAKEVPDEDHTAYRIIWLVWEQELCHGWTQRPSLRRGPRGHSAPLGGGARNTTAGKGTPPRIAWRWRRCSGWEQGLLVFAMVTDGKRESSERQPRQLAHLCSILLVSVPQWLPGDPRL